MYLGEQQAVSFQNKQINKNLKKNITHGSRCLLEICVSRRETLRILRQWHEECVQYNLELNAHYKAKMIVT